MRISDWSSDVCSSDLLDAEQSAFMMLLLGKPAQRVFDNDDGAIDDQTEVQGAKAHQIGRDASTKHPEAGQNHGDRDDQSRDQRRAEVSEQHEEHDDDQNRALQQVIGNRLDRRIDQFGEIERTEEKKYELQ